MYQSAIVGQLANWFLPQTLRESGDVYKIRQALLVVLFTFSAMVWAPVFAALNYLVLDLPKLGHISMFAVVLGAVVLAAIRYTGSYLLAANLLVLFLLLELTLVIKYTGGFFAPTVVWLAIVPIMAVLLAGRAVGVCWTAVATAGTVGLYALHVSGYEMQSLLDVRSTEITQVFSFLGVEILAFSLAYCYESIKRRTEQAVFEEQATLKQLLQTQEVERQLLAYDIHDGLTQTLAAALMHQEKGLDSDKIDLQALQTARKLMRDSLVEARQIIGGLRPPVLDERGLVAGIEYLIAGTEDLNVGFRHALNSDRLEPLLEGSLFRICQEALTNAVKYSSASDIHIALWQDQRFVRLIVEDNGIGFETTMPHTGSHGLAGIRQRARLLRGTATIESEPGSGTRIVVKVPIDPWQRRDELPCPR